MVAHGTFSNPVLTCDLDYPGMMRPSFYTIEMGETLGGVTHGTRPNCACHLPESIN